MWIEYLKIIYWIKLIVLPKGRGRKKEIKIRVLTLSRRVSISGDVKKKKSELRDRVSLNMKERIILDLTYLPARKCSWDHHQLVENMDLERKREFSKKSQVGRQIFKVHLLRSANCKDSHRKVHTQQETQITMMKSWGCQFYEGEEVLMNLSLKAPALQVIFSHYLRIFIWH